MDPSHQEPFSSEFLYAQWFTDPMCSWSYIANRSIQQFRKHFSDRLIFRERLFVLYRDLNEFLKQRKMTRPEEFVPKLELASRKSGVSIEVKAWRQNDVPVSSETCCLWVSSALRLDPEKGSLFIWEMRKAMYEEGLNIGSPEIIEQISKKAGLNYVDLNKGFMDIETQKALREDQTSAEKERVTVRPTLVLENSGGDRVFVGGLMDPELFIHAGEVLLREAE
jgi:putative protein-disulfide isomerase